MGEKVAGRGGAVLSDVALWRAPGVVPQTLDRSREWEVTNRASCREGQGALHDRGFEPTTFNQGHV